MRGRKEGRQSPPYPISANTLANIRLYIYIHSNYVYTRITLYSYTFYLCTIKTTLPTTISTRDILTMYTHMHAQCMSVYIRSVLATTPHWAILQCVRVPTIPTTGIRLLMESHTLPLLTMPMSLEQNCRLSQPPSGHWCRGPSPI